MKENLIKILSKKYFLIINNNVWFYDFWWPAHHTRCDTLVQREIMRTWLKFHFQKILWILS